MVPLAVEHAASFPEVTQCAAWQLDPVRRTVLTPQQHTEAWLAWCRDVEEAWGSCGRTVLVQGEPAGVLVHAPAAWLPGVRAMPTAPVSPDAVVVPTLWVAPEHRGEGLARMLVQGAAADLVRRFSRDGATSARAPVAMEAFGDTRGGRPCGPGATCVLPVEMWDRLGFVVHRPHATTPRVRMDLRRTVGWRAAAAQAWDRVRGTARPRPAPAPEASRATGAVTVRSDPRAP